MMKIVMLRHGQTYWNRAKKMQGKTDIPLNEIGKSQARRAAAAMPEVDLCLTSPLGRARQTAELALEGRNVPIVEEPLLLEQGYGLYEACSQRIGFHIPVHPLYNYTRRPEKYVPGLGGESFEDLYGRARKLLNERLLPMEGSCGSVLLSAHGAILCAVYNCMFDVPVNRFWDSLLPNCGIRTVQVENGIFRPAADE